MAIAANSKLLEIINRVNQAPSDQENLKSLAKIFLYINYNQLLLPEKSPAIGRLDLERAPLVWSHLGSPYKETFIAALFKHHISINNQFSEGVLDFLSYLTQNPSQPNGRCQSNTGPQNEISHDQQRLLGHIEIYSRCVSKLRPYKHENVNQLSESEIVEWLESAQKLHFCALMCFTDQQGQTGIPIYSEAKKRTFDETIKCHIPIPSMAINDERDLDRGYGGIEECRRVLHMFAKDPFDTSNSSGAEIVEYTKNLIRVALIAIYDHTGISSQTKDAIQAVTDDIEFYFCFKEKIL